jgi:hypothetical protein
MVVGSRRLLTALAFLATGLFSTVQVAHAENPPIKSIEPDLFPDQPAGIRHGLLLYHASLQTGFVWDSNIFSNRDNIIADRILLLRPGITVTTLDPNYKFTLRASMEHLDYEVSPSENRTDAQAELRGTIRVERDREIHVGTSAAHLSEPRSPQRRDLPEDAARPVEHNQYAAWLGFRKIFNPGTSTTTLTVESDDYLDARSNSGERINLQHLDRNTVKVAEEFEARLSHRLALFSRHLMTTIKYRDEPGFLQRDSIKYETVNGIEIGITPLIFSKLYFHFGEEHFWTRQFESDPERIYTAELTWSPRRNVVLKTTFARDFGGSSFELDSVGGRRTRADVILDYSITRRLFFRASFAYLHANEASLQTGQTRIEDTFLYKASLAYELTRYWNWYVDYAFEKRDAVIASDEFERAIVQTGVVARF